MQRVAAAGRLSLRVLTALLTCVVVGIVGGLLLDEFDAGRAWGSLTTGWFDHSWATIANLTLAVSIAFWQWYAMASASTRRHAWLALVLATVLATVLAVMKVVELSAPPVLWF